MFDQLNNEQQEVITEYAIRNNIELTDDNLDELATSYDKLINQELVNDVSKASFQGELLTFSQVMQRTKNEIINTMLEDLLTQSKEYGQNLVKVNYNSSASPLCIDRQNKVYWIEFPQGNYDELEPELFRSGGGLFHPNCRHNITAYFEGYSDAPLDPTPQSKSEIANAYDRSQQLNYLKRNKKKFYERKEKARLTGNASYEHNKNKWKEWNARINIF